MLIQKYEKCIKMIKIKTVKIFFFVMLLLLKCVCVRYEDNCTDVGP